MADDNQLEDGEKIDLAGSGFRQFIEESQTLGESLTSSFLMIDQYNEVQNRYPKEVQKVCKINKGTTTRLYGYSACNQMKGPQTAAPQSIA